MNMDENEVRRLRGLCFGGIHDPEWETVKDKWMEPENVEWLKKHSRIKPVMNPDVYWKEQKL